MVNESLVGSQSLIVVVQSITFWGHFGLGVITCDNYSRVF
jgi:hypothetical protein